MENVLFWLAILQLLSNIGILLVKTGRKDASRLLAVSVTSINYPCEQQNFKMVER